MLFRSIKKYNGLLYRSIKGVSKEVMQLFLAYHWEGNVRELEHVIEGAVNFVDDEIIHISDLPYNLKRYYDSTHQTQKSTVTLSDTHEGLVVELEKAEAKLIHEALAQSKGNIAKASRTLRIPRQTLQYKIKKYNLNE